MREWCGKMNAYTVTHMHACMHTFIHTHMHPHIHAYIHTHIHTQVWTDGARYGNGLATRILRTQASKGRHDG